jgi:hypothetical protein
MSATLITLPFQGDTLSYIVQDGEQMVPIRPICENLGLDWKSQHRKLMRGDRPWGCGHMTIPSAGGPQETLCLPQFMLPAWLFSVSPSKVRPDLRDKLVAYQKECAEVLYRHFILGDAAHPGVMKELALLRYFNKRLQLQVLNARPRWSRFHRLHHELRCGFRDIMDELGISWREAQLVWRPMWECGLLPHYQGDTTYLPKRAMEEMEKDSIHG